MFDIEAELGRAVRHFWLTRARQNKAQGARTGKKDTGTRAAVTGGRHADGFVNLVAAVLLDAGLDHFAIRSREKKSRTLPGHFRPTKEWDLVVIAGTTLVAAIEVKSQVGSFGNNFNKRVEEALGNATDFWAAYAKGRFAPSGRPWLGYLFMLEESPKSMGPTQKIELEPFSVDPVFQSLSYRGRYEEVCTRLVRERLYDAACFFTSSAAAGKKGQFSQPNIELGIHNFAIALAARAQAVAQSAKANPKH